MLSTPDLCLVVAPRTGRLVLRALQLHCSFGHMCHASDLCDPHKPPPPPLSSEGAGPSSSSVV